jgi:hypothetical protein
LLGVVEIELEIARRLSDANVVGDHLTELLGISE